MAAPTSSDVNAGKVFRKTALLEQPLPTFKSAPNVKPNPFVGIPQTDEYARKHHLVGTPPDTVLEATRQNPID